MKSKIRRKGCLGLFILFAMQLFFSCEEHHISPEGSSDYFLLADNIQLNYLKEYISSGDKVEVWHADTVTFTVLGDTLIEDLSYKKIMNQYGSLEKIVRKEGTQYFGRNHELYGGFSQEFMFLDTRVPSGGSWEYIKQEGYAKTEYVVKNLNEKHTVNGIEYKDVIKLEANYYTKYFDGINFQLIYTTEHYYAKGVGEIYTYYPVIASGMFNDLRFSLMPAMPK